MPEVASRDWFVDQLLAHLVYHCESTRSPLPQCEGVFVSFFVGRRLFCVGAAQVMAFSAGLLGVAEEEFVTRYGTGEVRHALEPEHGGLVALPGRTSERE